MLKSVMWIMEDEGHGIQSRGRERGEGVGDIVQEKVG